MLWFTCYERGAGLYPFSAVLLRWSCVSVCSLVWRDATEIEEETRVMPGRTPEHIRLRIGRPGLWAWQAPTTNKNTVSKCWGADRDALPGKPDWPFHQQRRKVQPKWNYTKWTESQEAARWVAWRSPRPNSLKRNLPNPYRLSETSRNYKLLRSHVLRKTKFKDQQDTLSRVRSSRKMTPPCWKLDAHYLRLLWKGPYISNAHFFRNIIARSISIMSCRWTWGFAKQHNASDHRTTCVSATLIQLSSSLASLAQVPPLRVVPRCIVQGTGSRSSRSVDGNNRCRPDYLWSSKSVNKLLKYPWMLQLTSSAIWHRTVQRDITLTNPPICCHLQRPVQVHLHARHPPTTSESRFTWHAVEPNEYA